MVLAKSKTLATLALLGSFGLGGARAGGLSPPAQRRQVALGLWGGDHIRMSVSNEGALIEYDCASGKIDRAIVLDEKGGFSAPGSYIPERGGPRREGDTVLKRVRYVGRVHGDTMRLTVRLEHSKQAIGVFTLTRGDDVLLTKCR